MNFPWGEELPTLTGERIVLRHLRETDLDALFEIFSDAQTMRYWISPPHRDRVATEQLFRDIQKEFQERRFFQWGVARQTDDRVIGTCTLFRLDEKHRRAEIGYALARAHWGVGYATEAISALIRFAFEELQLHRLEADVDPRNIRSLRSLERQGFRREGTQQERYWLSGEIQDGALLGLLRRDWPPHPPRPDAAQGTGDPDRPSDGRKTMESQSPMVPAMPSALLGSWALVRWSARLADGSEVLPFGEMAQGRLAYGADGRMSVQIMRRDRSQFQDGDPLGGTPLEIEAAYHGFIAYYGSYSVDVENRVVCHRIEGSSFPNWVGTAQERSFEASGTELTLTARPQNVTVGPRAGAHHTLLWRRE